MDARMKDKKGRKENMGKKMKHLQLWAILAVGLALIWASNAVGGITGSAHDFSGKAWNSTGEMCVVCHTPHNADTTVTDAPLWNHGVTTTNFTLYSSSTLNATVGQPGGVSKLCLSCHDGTVALENFGGNTNGTNFAQGGALVGTDLSDDHPISITYDAALATADGELADPTGTAIDPLPLFSNKLECATCHDVHNGAGGHPDLLRKANTDSALCLTCHLK